MNVYSKQLSLSYLEWLSSEGATHYEIWFGTDPTPDNGEYKGVVAPIDGISISKSFLAKPTTGKSVPSATVDQR